MITYHEEVPDVETYFELRKAVDWAVFSEEQAKKALDCAAFAIIAKDGDRTVAMGRVIGDGMYYRICDVVVRPEYQGQKIGATMLDKLVNLCIKDAPENSRISVDLIAALGKDPFYIKQGFKALPNENCGPALRKVFYF